MTTATQAPGHPSVRRGGAVRLPGGHPHERHPVTDEPVIDMDALPADLMVGVAVDRLLRLRRGEQAELRGGSDPRRVWREVDRLIPAGYGFAYLENGPDRWRVQVTHRPAA